MEPAALGPEALLRVYEVFWVCVACAFGVAGCLGGLAYVLFLWLEAGSRGARNAVGARTTPLQTENRRKPDPASTDAGA